MAIESKSLTVAGITVQARVKEPDSTHSTTHILPGFGSDDYDFPSVETVVANSLARIGTGSLPLDTSDIVVPKQQRKRALTKKASASPKPNELRAKRRSRKASQTDSAIVEDDSVVMTSCATSQMADPSIAPTSLPPEATVSAVSETGELPGPTGKPASPVTETQIAQVGGILYTAAEGLRLNFYMGRFDAIIAERFDPIEGAVNYARLNLEQRYQPTVTSLLAQTKHARNKIYAVALPRALSVLVALNPNVPFQRLLQIAVTSLDQELYPILYVLRIWTDCFAQLRDGMYAKLQAVTFMMEQAFILFKGGRLEGCCGRQQACCGHLKLDTSIFQTNNTFLARFTNGGLSTYPGAKGPNGAHVLNVTHGHKNAISLILSPICHEFRHDMFYDIKGYAQEVVVKAITAIVEEYKAGRLRFSTEKITFGKNRIPTIEAIAQVVADTISEDDADIAGGISLTGPAFVYNLLMLFSALNFSGRSILAAGVDEQLLSAESEYTIDEATGRPRVETHLPDYIRAYFGAAALDEIGFHRDAANCRRIADQAVGLPLPEFITWKDGSEENPSKAVLKIAVADLKLVAPILARTLIRAKFDALGGLALCDLINWTPDRQRKVDLLVDNLMIGSSEVPTDQGDFLATYVAAAATLFYLRAVGEGRRVGPVLESCEANALKMLDTIRLRSSQPPVSTTQGDCPCDDSVPLAATVPPGGANVYGTTPPPCAQPTK